MKQYLWCLLIALDQLGNALAGGYPDETLSSRAYRADRAGKPLGRFFRPLIDALFSPFEDDHCRTAWQSEVFGRQLPKSFRRG